MFLLLCGRRSTLACTRQARELEKTAAAKGVEIILPTDVVVADAFAADANTQVHMIYLFHSFWNFGGRPTTGDGVIFVAMAMPRNGVVGIDSEATIVFSLSDAFFGARAQYGGRFVCMGMASLYMS